MPRPDGEGGSEIRGLTGVERHARPVTHGRSFFTTVIIVLINNFLLSNAGMGPRDYYQIAVGP